MCASLSAFSMSALTINRTNSLNFVFAAHPSLRLADAGNERFFHGNAHEMLSLDPESSERAYRAALARCSRRPPSSSSSYQLR
jgi:hypothetical protein